MPGASQRRCRNSGSSSAKLKCAEMFGPTRRLGKKIGKFVRSQQSVAHAERPQKACWPGTLSILCQQSVICLS